MRYQTVTVYHAIGEDATGKMRWTRQTLTCVRYERRNAAVEALSGAVVTDGLLVVIPTRNGYVEPEDYSGTGWTIRDGDMVATGVHAEPDPRTIPGRQVFRVTGVEPYYDASGRFHHFEVSAS
jgi:hypothetical protein